MASREQMAVLEFSESLLIIPKVLAVNAAKDATASKTRASKDATSKTCSCSSPYATASNSTTSNAGTYANA